MTVTYNSEALNFDHKTATQTGDTSDAFGGEGLLLSPLKYDAEVRVIIFNLGLVYFTRPQTIRVLAKAFGPVEHIAPYSAYLNGIRCVLQYFDY